MQVTNPPGAVTVIPVPVATPVVTGQDVGVALVAALRAAGCGLRDGDVVAIASKVVALGESAVVGVAPLPRPPTADPRRALARSQARRIVADAPQALIVATAHGFVCANAGIDASNVADGLLLLPADPDASAQRLRDHLHASTGADVAVVVTDTFGRPWRMGQVDVALGVAGMAALRDERGEVDLHGRRLDVTVAAVADEVAGAADLVRTKSSGVPFVVLRGLDVAGNGSGADLVRPLDEDLFPAGGPTLFDHAVTHAAGDPAPVRAADPAPRGTADPAPRGTADPARTEATDASPDPRPDDADMGTLVASVVAVVGNVARPGVGLAVAPGQDATISVTGPSALEVGMAVEAVRITLAGRDLAIASIEVDEDLDDEPTATTRVLVHVAAPRRAGVRTVPAP